MTQGNPSGNQNREARRAGGRRGAAARRDGLQGGPNRQRTNAEDSNQRLTIALIWGIVGLVIVGLVIWALLITVLKPQPGVLLADLGHEHVDSLDAVHRPYNSSPPTSGPHVNGGTRIGIYEEQLPDPLQVAMLEAGFVLVQYDCPTPCQAILDDLTLTAGRLMQQDRKVILAPYSGIRDTNGQPRRIALSAWSRLQTFDRVDVEAVKTFINAYEGRTIVPEIH